MRFENAFERCAANLTLVTVRLERLSEYYDRNLTGSDLAGVYEHSAEKFGIDSSRRTRADAADSKAALGAVVGLTRWRSCSLCLPMDASLSDLLGYE